MWNRESGLGVLNQIDGDDRTGFYLRIARHSGTTNS